MAMDFVARWSSSIEIGIASLSFNSLENVLGNDSKTLALIFICSKVSSLAWCNFL